MPVTASAPPAAAAPVKGASKAATRDPSKGAAYGPGFLDEDMLYGVNVAASHISIRMGFIRKVYGILAAQLILTVAMSALTMYTPALRAFVQTNPGLVQMANLLSLVMLLPVYLYRHKTPTNFVLLAAWTCCLSFLVATVVTFYDTLVVLQAFILCAGIATGLTLYAFQTTHDFTPLLSTLVTLLWGVVLVGLLQLFLPFTDSMEFLMSVGSAALFSAFIVVDTQMLMRKLSADEYILCAISLYLDLVNLFLHILRILGKRQ